MLVISRKAGESIILDAAEATTAELVVLGVSHGRVKLGFAGNKKMSVRRGELTKEQRAATAPAEKKSRTEGFLS